MSDQPLWDISESETGKKQPETKIRKRNKGTWIVRTSRGRWLLILIAAILGGSGTAVYSLTQKQALEPIIVLTSPATRDLPLTTNDVEVGTIPAGYYPKNELVTPAEFSDGTVWPITNLPTGTILTHSLIRDFQRIVDQIPAGKEAVSFTVPANDALNGDIRPGDIVNITIYGLDPIALNGSDVPANPSYTQFGSANTVVGVEISNVTIQRVEASTKGLKDAGGESVKETQIGPDTPLTAGGIPTIYYVFLDPEQADLVKMAVSTESNIILSVPSQMDAKKSPTEVFANQFVQDATAADTTSSSLSDGVAVLPPPVTAPSAIATPAPSTPALPENSPTVSSAPTTSAPSGTKPTPTTPARAATETQP